MNRRSFIRQAVASILTLLVMPVLARAAEAIQQIAHTDAEWMKILTPEQFHVLRGEGTEPPFTSSLLHETRKGIFACAGCDLPLFPSEYKFDSGTGWPSFFDVMPGHIVHKLDTSLLMMPREEYHCVRCGGHHGHVFNDGPKPTGLRYCNNGVALKFVPKA